MVQPLVVRSIPNQRTTYGQTAPHSACGAQQGADPEVIALLLERGREAGAVDEDGAIPLHDLRPGSAATAALLLDHGADPDKIDRWGWTPVHGAAVRDAADVIEVLLARGASPDLRTHHSVVFPLGAHRYKQGSIPADIARPQGSDAALAILEAH